MCVVPPTSRIYGRMHVFGPGSRRYTLEIQCTAFGMQNVDLGWRYFAHILDDHEYAARIQVFVATSKLDMSNFARFTITNHSMPMQSVGYIVLGADLHRFWRRICARTTPFVGMCFAAGLIRLFVVLSRDTFPC